MKFGQDSALLRMVDKRWEEYRTTKNAEERARAEKALIELCRRLGLHPGLKPGEILRDFLLLSPSKTFVDDNAPMELDPDISSAIEYLFNRIDQIYHKGDDWDGMAKKTSK